MKLVNTNITSQSIVNINKENKVVEVFFLSFTFEIFYVKYHLLILNE